jgi:hypothetical protein
MALSISRGGSSDRVYENPPKGSFAATLCDVIDEGERENKFEPGEMQHQFRLTYLIGAPMSDGRPFAVSEWVNKSLFKAIEGGKQSNMVGRIEALAGVSLEELDVPRFEDEMALLESLIGRSALVTIKHTVKADKSQGTKIAAVVEIPKGMAAPEIDGFKRAKDRDGYQKPAMTDKQKITLLWAKADDRAKTLGDPKLKEPILRAVYAEFGIKATHEAVESPRFSQIVDAVCDWTPMRSEDEEPPPMGDDEIPF